MTTPSPFQVELARLRDRAGLSQRALGERMAAHLGEPLTGQAISEWERGNNLPNRRNAVALEEALGVDPGTLTRLLGDDNRSINDRLDELEARFDQFEDLLRSAISRRSG